MIKKMVILNRFSIVPLVFWMFSFLIDSGGPIGIRVLSLSIFMLICFKYLYDFPFVRIPNEVIISYISIIFFSLYSVVWSCINGIDFFSTLHWVMPILFLPVFSYCFTQFNPEVVKKSFIYSGVCFSVCVFAVFGCLLVMGNVVTVFFDAINFPGWFYVREDGYPQVYFQATLAFVVLAIYAFFNDYKKCSMLFLFTLMLSLSRFGSLIVIIFFALNLFLDVRRLSTYSFCFLVLAVVLFLPLIIFIYNFLPQDFNYNIDASTVRLGHIVSVFNSMKPIDFILGMGPGSEFYSAGSASLTDNIEVSQLELFRKYGILGYGLFNFSFIYLSWFFLKVKNYSSQICMCAFYFVSYSNPVLLTFLFPMFVGVFLGAKNSSVEYIAEKNHYDK